MNRTTLAAAAVAALALPLAMAPAASAASVVVVDGNDSTMKADLDRVRVAHNPKLVRVRVTFDNVRRRGEPGQTLAVFLDTDPAEPGPEFRLDAGLNHGTDYRFAAITRWAAPGRHVNNCNYEFAVDWKADVATFQVPRKCLGKPETVAAAVRVNEYFPRTNTLIDWMTGVRQFSPALAVG